MRLADRTIVNHWQDDIRLLLLTGTFLPYPAVASLLLAMARGKLLPIIFSHKIKTHWLSFSASTALIPHETVVLPPLPFIILLPGQVIVRGTATAKGRPCFGQGDVLNDIKQSLGCDNGSLGTAFDHIHEGISRSLQIVLAERRASG